MNRFGNSIAFHFDDSPRRGWRPAIFLDRDGVINQRVVGGYVTTWNGFRFLDGVVPALRGLSRFELPLIVVSNQAGVGKRLMSRAALGRITERFVSHLTRAGAPITAAYYCPHAPDAGCQCRKPRPGLLLRAARDWRINLSRSILIGDSPSDVEAARAAGCRSILFDPQDEFSAYRQPHGGNEVVPRVVVVRTISEVVVQATALLERYLPGPDTPHTRLVRDL
ncbi:MAG TPA: HAD family hydrolase [Terriglobia bacterium]|nr:HAD family hydrolase [Terriglobia bacterium]